MARTSRARSAPGPERTACSVAASRISSNMSRWLLHAAPSAPERDRDAARPHLGDRRDAGAELQVRAGTVQHLHPRSASTACSWSSTQTQCARHRCGAVSPTCDEIVDVAKAGPLADQRDLVAVLRGMGVHEQRVLPRQVRDGLEQFARARHGESRREGRAQPPVGPAVPARRQRQALVHGRLRALEQPRRHRGVGVHHALADHGAQARRLERLEHRVGVVHRLHRQHGGGAAQQQFGSGERGGGAPATAACAPPPSARCASAASRAARRSSA